MAFPCSHDKSMINIQDFIREGKSFVPLFSDIATATRLLAEAKFDPGVQFREVRVDYLASNFSGPEWLVINAGDEFMFELYAFEIKSVLLSTRSSSVTAAKEGATNGHRTVFTAPTSVRIGKPSDPPALDALLEMQMAVSSTTAHLVYWFWMSISGSAGHLGLAVIPSDGATINQVGSMIEPIWKKYRPDNLLISILPLRDPSFLEIVRNQGEVLYERRTG